MVGGVGDMSNEFNYIYSLYRLLNEKGCRVSISEIKDAIDLLQYVDPEDSDLVFNVLATTLGKDESCYVALEESVMQIKKMVEEMREEKKGEED